MNILVINWRDIKHPRAGGAEVRLHKVYEPMVKRGHSVTLISSQFDGCKDSETINGISVIRYGNDFSFPFIVMKNLNKWIKNYAIDIVVEDFNKLPFLTPLYSTKPTLIQMHHLWLTSIFKEESFVAATIVWLGEQSLRFFYKKSKFCVVSESTKNELTDYYKIPQKNIKIIYNGVDLDFYTPPHSIGEKKPFLFWLGRIQKYKGIIDACEAFSRISKNHPNVSLKIAGKGPYLTKLKKWIDTHNLQNKIELLGFISDEEKCEYLQNATALLQTSYKEGWGLTVIEANSCGTPVIANNAPGLKDSVRDNETGLLYDYGNIDSLVEKINLILENQELYNKIKSNCRTWAEEFDWETPSLQTEELLSTILKQ